MRSREMKRKQLWLVGIVLLLVVGCQSSDLDESLAAKVDATFREVVLESNKPVLVDFYATWCAPCKQMNPIVDELKEEYEGKAVVHKVDIDKHQKTAQACGVEYLPTFIIFADGKKVDQVVGGTDKADLAARLDAAID
jgi:thioredoxin 1